MAKTPSKRPPVPMAPAYMKPDSTRVDTSKAPWMKIAEAERRKGVNEKTVNDTLAAQLCLSMVQAKSSARLLDVSLTDVPRPQPTSGLLLQKVAQTSAGEAIAERNPEIAKYFAGLKTDPARDPKKKWRSGAIAAFHTSDAGFWQVTAWCAAFVNWCLSQAGAPHLGYATAASWLQFGTPLPAPEYGCITVIPAAASTGSTTGHVAFYVETIGDKIVLLGGNQRDAVNYMEQPADRVLRYRWPTHYNHFLLDRSSGLA